MFCFFWRVKGRLVWLVMVAGLSLLSSCSRIQPSLGKITREIKDPTPDAVLKNREGELLSKAELEVLLRRSKSKTEAKSYAAVKAKADRLFASPFVDNSVYEADGLPSLKSHPKLGPSIRLSTLSLIHI